MSRPRAVEDVPVRGELLEVLASYVWVQETARARIFAAWGGAFSERERLASERAELGRAWAREHGVDLPDALVAQHEAWLRSFVGATPDQIPTGPGFLDYAGSFLEAYVASRLGFDPSELRPSEALPEPEAAPAPVDPVIDRIPPADSTPVDPTGPCFVVLVDLHIGAPGAAEALTAAVEDINRIDPSFVIVGGDLTERGEPEEFREVQRILSGLGVPWHAVLGNHDVVRQSTATVDGMDHFAEAFGYASEGRILECGDLQAVMVDSADPTPWTFAIPTGDGDVRIGTIGVIGGTVDAEQIERIRTGVDPERPVLLVSHHQLQPYAGFPALLGGVLPAHSDALLDALSGHDLRGALVGHTHRCAVSTVGAARIPQIELPAAGKWPFAYTVVAPATDGPEAVVRQISDEDLVRSLASGLTSTEWVFGPQSTLRHTFVAAPSTA